MAALDVKEYLRLLPVIQGTPDTSLWLSYDVQADTLYVNFRKPSIATDSEITDDDVIVRYDGQDVIGFTILHASKRSG